VASLFAYFDESGKFHDHSVVSLSGFVDILNAGQTSVMTGSTGYDAQD
jgi:hypothetical protein